MIDMRLIKAYLGLLRDGRGYKISPNCLKARRIGGKKSAQIQIARAQRRKKAAATWENNMRDPDFAWAAAQRAAHARAAKLRKAQ